jgi:TRAP-type C4-dicarboxylate transport system permease small subunit
MFARAVKYIGKGISYLSNSLSVISMVALVFVMVAVVIAVLARWLFDAPLRGTWELVTLGFAIVVWAPMAMAALKGQHVALTLVLDRLPRRPKLALEVIIALVSSGVLGMLSWRLVMYGIRLGQTISRTPLLKIPYEPFLYFAAAAVAVMALAFLARIPETVAANRKEQ